MITINTFGRFGNNVRQFINAIYIAKKKNIPCIKYSFIQFNNTQLRIPTDSINPTKLSGSFYTIDTVLSFEDKHKIALKYLLPILKYSTMETGFEKYYMDSLFVHIRSGDIFKGDVHEGYAQPPLDYYSKIFNLESRQILVFYEDDENPVVNVIKEKYPTIIFNSVKLKVLITIFMNARYIVNSVGSLISSILLFNKHLKKVYSLENSDLDQSKLVKVDLPNYITSWHNTKEQRDLMLTYIGLNMGESI